MHDTLLQQGLDLMLFGMGTVFVFLTLLVIATMGMSFLVQRFFREPESEIPVVSEPGFASATDPRLLAIIKAAIDRHRNKK